LLCGILLPLAGVACTPLAAAGTPSPTAPPSEVRLGDADNGRQVELKMGQQLVVSLEGNPSTGYTWEVTEVDAKVLRQSGEPEFQPQSNLPGAPALITLRFQTVGAGTTDLKLAYRRPWEKNTPPAQTFAVRVSVR